MVEKFHLDDKVLQEKGVGYVENKRFNLDWERQGLNCPYEHCIETMPLRGGEAMQAVKAGMIYDLRKDKLFPHMDKQRIREIPKEKPELYKEIRKILDKRGIKDDECWFMPDLNAYIANFGESQKSCGLFGHECPGGERQVKECELEGKFSMEYKKRFF